MYVCVVQKYYNKILNFTYECEVSSKVVLLKIKCMLPTLEQYSNSFVELDNEIVELMLNQNVSEDDLNSKYE